ncbi:MAG: hypothetical protein JNL42_17875 [Anaerolineae bacterium]|nr:hypothetical protein [Anaerolineae bacterium]
MKKGAKPYHFDLKAFFPDYIFDRITGVRVDDPAIITRQAQSRKQRPQLAPRGKLTILAADHPGRGVTNIGGQPFAMGDRQQYLGRILRVLLATEFDGFMSTPDMIDELLIVDYLVQQGGGPSFLDGRVLIGCMQRGGVAGVVGEIDDRFGAYSAEAIAEQRLDGGKMLLRFDPSDERTLDTVDYCARAVTDLNRHHLPSFVEPLRTEKADGRYVLKNTMEELIKLVGVCASFGDSSRYTWLKLPYCEGFDRVAQATTLPIILLGGPSEEDPSMMYASFASGVKARSNVRGVMVGRNVTYPGREDPAAVAHAVHGIVYHSLSAADAPAAAAAHRDAQFDALTRYIKP